LAPKSEEKNNKTFFNCGGGFVKKGGLGFLFHFAETVYIVGLRSDGLGVLLALRSNVDIQITDSRNVDKLTGNVAFITPLLTAPGVRCQPQER
jgi:hypothetical protein